MKGFDANGAGTLRPWGVGRRGGEAECGRSSSAHVSATSAIFSQCGCQSSMLISRLMSGAHLTASLE